MFQNILSLENLMAWVIVHGIKIVIILAAAFITVKAAKVFVSRCLHRVVRKSLQFANGKADIDQEREKTLVRVSVSILKVIIWAMAILTILPELGINIGPLLAGIGIAGLALGFGARSLVQDYISGLFILLEDHYQVGEEIEAAGAKGRVKDFNLRRTVIQGPEGVIHYIPNSQIKKSSNFSRK